jgi:hypothetical protein
MTESREHAHHLIDRLPETQLSALVGRLETIVDPAYALRTAPIDDEPEAAEERHDVAVARDWLRKNGGKGIPHDEAMRRLGLWRMEIEWSDTSLDDMAQLDPGISPASQTVGGALRRCRRRRREETTGYRPARVSASCGRLQGPF